MNVSIGRHWEVFVEDTVAEGRFASASDVVREGLRLMEERETKQKSLRETIQVSIVRGGSNTAEDVRAYLREQRLLRSAEDA